MFNTMKHRSLLMLVLLAGLAACAFHPATQPVMQLAKAKDETSLELARELIDQGKPAEAITAFRSLQRSEGSSLLVLNGLAIAHAELGRPDLAADFFAMALTRSPDDPATLNNIGYAALRRQETGLARRYLEMARQHDKGAPEIGNNLDALDRMQARRRASLLAKPSKPDAIAGGKIAMQRRTESIVRLSRRQPPTNDEGAGEDAPMLQNATLIDFSDLRDPWSLVDHAAGPSF